MNRPSLVRLVALALGVLLLGTACSTVRVRITGDRGVRYQAAWTERNRGTQTRSGDVPVSFTFNEDFVGWFQNAAGAGQFRVRVYEGFGVLVDQSSDNTARRIVIERKGKSVGYRLE